ncbi:alkylation response protein AidB-like acyl-CoA dehydrogenase [Nakamurella sp. UYEF19]|uniref:acyl-CoA dehydrogenase family protein n=1 Tax=Nakamurella sp. UYEF19 TaxID=1756392 RepID=UPI0033921DD2
MADFSDPSEYADLRSAVREITDAHGAAEYAEHARTATPQSGLWSDLGKAGFIGINVPTEYGGGGAGMSELAIVTEESAAGGCPLLLLLVSSAIGVEVLARHGSAAQKQEWLTQLSDGSIKMAFAITEPDAGSNSHQITTTAVRDGDDYLISGSKYYISGVDESAAILTVVRTGVDEVTGKARMSLFVVPTSTPGLSWNVLPVAAQIPDKQFTVFFDQVRVPASALIGAEGEGLRPLFDGLNPERIATAAICVGIGRYAVEVAAAYAKTRNVWGTPIGTHQGVSHPLARAKIAVEVAALMTAKAAWQHDNGLPAGEASNMAKYAASEAALAAVDAAMQTHGGNGLSVEYGLVPLWGMARLLRIAPVNSEMVLNYVAQHTLGLPRSY